MSINELLQRWAEIEPEVCRVLAPGRVYEIGIYRFWFDDNGEMTAYANATFHHYCSGDPAHAWLRDAVEREVARRGWVLRTLTLTDGGNCVVIANRYESEWFSTMAEALLSAFIAACEAPARAGDAGER